MDIKTKIDSLTEAEAKEVLEQLIGRFSMLSYITSNTEMTPNEIENHFFDEALEMMEWRRRHDRTR